MRIPGLTRDCGLRGTLVGGAAAYFFAEAAEYLEPQVAGRPDAAGQDALALFVLDADMSPTHHPFAVGSRQDFDLAHATTAAAATDRDALLAQGGHAFQHGPLVRAAVGFPGVFDGDGEMCHLGEVQDALHSTLDSCTHTVQC